jgi:hypothetical protein
LFPGTQGPSPWEKFDVIAATIMPRAVEPMRRSLILLQRNHCDAAMSESGHNRLLPHCNIYDCFHLDQQTLGRGSESNFEQHPKSALGALTLPRALSYGSYPAPPRSRPKRRSRADHRRPAATFGSPLSPYPNRF